MTSDIFDDFFGSFDEMNKRFERMFSNLCQSDNVRTYGYTMYRGPDGVPHVYEYGNTVGQNNLLTTDELLTDVTVNDDNVILTMEIPGVKKEDIQLEGGKDSVTVSVNTPEKKFEKTVALPNEVDIDTASAIYNNGILELTMKSLVKKPKGKRIEIQ